MRRVSLAPEITVVLVLLLSIGVAVFRFQKCLEPAIHSNDLPRQIYYGQIAREKGLAEAGTPLGVHYPDLVEAGWHQKPYNYPPVFLAFFAGGTLLGTSLFFWKVLLTVMEGLNAILLGRLTRSWWVGLLYWATPSSVWWVSHEGQPDPLQNLLILGALLFTQQAVFARTGARVAAFLLLGLAIQVKLFAVLLLPYFLWRLREPGARVLPLLALVASGLPSLVAQLHYPMLSCVFDTLSYDDFSVYGWRTLPHPMSSLNFKATFWTMQSSHYLAMLLCLLGVLWTRRWTEFLAPASMLLMLRFMAATRPWYPLLFPALAAPIGQGPPDSATARRLRLALLLLWPLMDLYSLTHFPSPESHVLLNPFAPLILPR